MGNITYAISMRIRRKFSFIYGLGYQHFGKNTVVYKPLLILGKKNISLGDNVFIRNGVRMEVIEKRGGQRNSGIIDIGDYVSIEQNCHITSGGQLTIGSGTTISADVYISNISHEYSDINTSVLKQPLSYKETIIGNNCFIGYGARIMPGVHLGDGVIVGTNAVVLKDVPDHSIVVGVPAKVVKRFNANDRVWEKV